MPKEERAYRGRLALLAVTFAPTICILGAVQNSLLVPNPLTALTFVSRSI
jgi:hypothetical protein